MTVNPTIVICPSGWALESLFQPLMQALEGLGCPTIFDRPAGYPDTDPIDAPEVSFDVDRLRNKILMPLIDEGRDVMLFMHSYGGLYGPGAVKGLSKKEREASGLKGGIIVLLYATAFVARKGTSAISAMGINPDALPDWISLDKTTGMVGVKKEHAKAMLFHDTSDEEAERLAQSLPKRPYSCFSTPLQYDPYDDPNFEGIFGYIHTGADRVLSYDLQKRFVEVGGIKETLLLMESSHSPHIEHPEILVEKLFELVRRILA